VTAGRRLTVALVVLGVTLAVVAAISLFLGSAALSPGAVVRALSGRAGAESVESIVTLQIRLPRVAAAALAGGALAVAGVAFQGLTRNPLAEPSVLGVSSGAAAVVAGRIAAADPDAVVVTIFPDGGARYLSEPFWSEAA